MSAQALGGLPPRLALDLAAKSRICPEEAIMMEGVGTSPARYLAKSPPVQLAGEGRKLKALREEAREGLEGEFVRVADEEPIASGQPRNGLI